jgi:hypothetical protein
MTGIGVQAMAKDTAWDAFVARSAQGTIFCSAWWLDAAVGRDRWQRNAVTGEDGSIVAAWPGVVRRTRAGKVLVGAPLTPWLGPLLTAGEGKQRRSREIEQLEQLVDGPLAEYVHVEARCSPAFDYWTPLRWNGFTQTTHYTWQLHGLEDLEAVERGLRESTRRQLKKARREQLEVVEGNVDDLVRLNRLTFERQGLDEAVPEAVLARIATAALENDAGTILVARDGDGNMHTASLFVHDARTTWYLVGGSDPALRSSGSATLVMWSGIERAAARGTAFDFEGSMLRHVERFVRGFGGEPMPYSIVHRTPSRAARLERSLKRTARATLRRG